MGRSDVDKGGARFCNTCLPILTGRSTRLLYFCPRQRRRVSVLAEKITHRPCVTGETHKDPASVTQPSVQTEHRFDHRVRPPTNRLGLCSRQPQHQPSLPTHITEPLHARLTSSTLQLLQTPLPNPHPPETPCFWFPSYRSVPTIH
jgi:hypothetical protein